MARNNGRRSAAKCKGVHSIRPVERTTAETRIGERIVPQPNGCWLYKGQADEYGTAKANGTVTKVHRFVYETLVGPIPDGHHLHHTCLTPGCCNPAHLQPLTPKDHVTAHRVA